MKLTNLKSIKDSTVKFAKTFVTSVIVSLIIATTLVTSTSAYASKSSQTAPSTPKVYKASPKVYHGANWDNSKSYVIRKVRYH